MNDLRQQNDVRSIAVAEHLALVSAARADGAAVGVAKVRARIRAILSGQSALFRQAAALELALRTNLAPEDCEAVLVSRPDERPAWLARVVHAGGGGRAS